MTKILGSVSEIRIVWRCKPELRSRMIRHMMKQKGQPGVMALSKALNVNYKNLDEIGGLKGWIGKRNCQRRQRKNRQKRKTNRFSIEKKLEDSNNIHINGCGKCGKGGGRQDLSRRKITQSTFV